MIKAFKSGESLLVDLHDLSPSPDQLDIWWLGQSGYLLHWNGKKILLDPYLSDTLTKKYEGTDKPHVRMSERAIDPAWLRDIDFLTSSHVHTDHLDPETVSILVKNNPHIRFIIPESIRSIASHRAQCDFNRPIGLNAGQKYTVGDISFLAVPAAHETLDQNEDGQHLYLGYIVTLGPWTIYHSGDTLLYPELHEWVKPFVPDISFLPINGGDPSRRVAGNMNAAEAVWLAEKTNTKLVIPGHYHMFEFNSVEPDEFIALAKKQSLKFKVLEIGERLSLKL